VETPKGGGLGALARNFAVGPAEGTAVTTGGVQIPWGTTDVPGFTFADVPITPRVSGIVRVTAVVCVANSTSNPATLIVEVQVDGVTQIRPLHEEVTVPFTNGGEETSGFAAVPIETEILGLVLGTAVNIQIKVTALTADALTLTTNNSSIEVQEVLPSTG
jgi:hypothetical protein